MTARRWWLWLLLAQALPALAVPRVLPSAGARAKKGPPAKGVSAPGEVQYVTATLAYLDRGAADGVSVGLSVNFTRGGRQVGSCTVDTVAEHFATCLAGQLKKGDRFAIGRKVDDALPGPPTELTTPEELAARRDVLGTTGQALVDFDGDSGGAEAHRVAVALGHTSYGSFNRESGPFHIERLDAAVFDVDLWKGLRVSADVSVLAYTRRPDNYRSVFGPNVVLLIRQLEVGFRRADVPFQAALGRLWTHATPGLLVVDGAQASYRAGDWLEVGAYGGLLPDAYALTVTPTQWTVGAFASLKYQSGKGAESTVGQVDVRAGYAFKEQLEGRFEVGLAAHLYKGKSLDAHVMAELGFGGKFMALGGLDAVRFDVGWRPIERFHLLLGGRYRGGSPNGVVELGLVSPGQRAIHSDLAATFDVAPWLVLALNSGVAADIDGGVLQGRVGPELSLPSLFGKGTGLSFGYAEELGWLRGRSVYAQFIFSILGRVRLLSRTTFFQQIATDAFVNDVGESVNIDVTIFRWLWVRASMSGRTAVDPEPGITRTAGLASLQVGGQF